MIGQNAPDFTLKNTAKEPISLSNYRGKTVILAFYSYAFTGVSVTKKCAHFKTIWQFECC